MKRFQFAYRHADGGIRAYIGYGFADYSAKDDGIRKLREYAASVGETLVLCGPNHRCIMSKADCRKGEHEAIKRQWRSMRQAALKAGASIV